MNEVTGRVDMAEFSRKIGLTVNQTMEQVQTLSKTGFVSKTNTGYVITEKGKSALKASFQVSTNKRFYFHTGINRPNGVSAGTLKEFHDAVKIVEVASLEFHLYRGDFENWFLTSVNEAAFADELALMKKSELKGEALRKAIVTAMDSRYSLQ
jgi:hypothetical protein